MAQTLKQDNDPLTEIGAILALGIMRLEQRKKLEEQATSTHKTLDFRAVARIHGDEENSHE